MNTDFFITAMVVVIVPGTGVIYTVSSGLFHGRRASIFAAIGCTLGIVPHLVASILGLSALLHTSAEIFQFLKLLGVLYLLYLAWGMWRNTGSLRFDSFNGTRGGWAIAIRGTLINVLNPKLTIFFFAFLPQFLTDDSSASAQMLVLGAVFMVITLVVFVFYGLLASKLRDRVVDSPRTIKILQRGFAGVFALFAIRLAFQDR